jgi:hypothetical protein
MQRLKIDLLKFTGAKHFKSKDGTDHIAIPVADNNIYVGGKGSYAEITLLENRDGRDQYDNDGFASLDVGKQRREAGEKGTILGNWKHIGDRGQTADSTPATRAAAAHKTAKANAYQPENKADEDDGDLIPF